MTSPLLDAMQNAVAANRIESRVRALSAIGRSVRGITRLGLTAEEQQAKGTVAGWLKSLGYACAYDEALNLLAVPPEWNGVIVGSHLDTVPHGGSYDGALGVVAAVEAAQALTDAGVSRRPLVAAWTDEEGVRFGKTLLGSAAALGHFTPRDWARQDHDGVSVRRAADRLRAGVPRGSLSDLAIPPPHAYLELHIEQGPRLAEMGSPVGVVSSIVGVTHALITLEGAADHAGTTPMDRRHDALTAAAELILWIEDQASRMEDLVATVGEITVEPGAQNVVAGMATFSLDVRSPADPVRTAFLSRTRRQVRGSLGDAACGAGWG